MSAEPDFELTDLLPCFAIFIPQLAATKEAPDERAPPLRARARARARAAATAACRFAALGLDLEAVEWTRQWLAEVGEQPL